MKRTNLVVATVVAVSVACGVLTDGAPGAAPKSVAELGTRAEWRIQPPPKLPGLPEASEATPGPDRAAAAKAWREKPNEAAALGLARAYYPELLVAKKPEPASALNPSTALSVKLPERAGEPMEISTRGHTFRVTRLGGAGAAAGHREAASFYGPTQLLAAAGPAQRVGGRLLAQRIEEYDVVEGGATHRAEYRIELPSGISGLRDTGGYLEFSDGKGGPPVLRMHYPQVRDATGMVRAGVVGLRGVSEVADGKGCFVAAGTLEAEISLDLAGLRGPLVVDPGWSSTGAMAIARRLHTATLLPSGKVLVAGGYGGSGALRLASAELYDPVSGTWTATGAMAAARGEGHTASLLPSGKVLVVGGSGASGYLASAELYDPGAGTWSTTGALAGARGNHTATLLPSGMVLVAGGLGAAGSVNSAELYDPGAGTWTAIAALNRGRYGHTATRLPSGKVLVAGGSSTTGLVVSAELYDPGAGTWATTGALGTPRFRHTATLLPSGKVLVSGGRSATATQVASVELYDPGVGTWTATGALATARETHTATLLPTGKVLVVGGYGGSVFLSSTELFDPGVGTWTAAGALATVRGDGHTATLLPTGKVLVAGGFDGSGSLASAEGYDPGAATWTATGPLATPRRFHTATLLPSGEVLVAGGESTSGSRLASAELYDPGTGTWASTGSLADARASHTATLLPSGKVLVAGGIGDLDYLASAELYDPVSGTWTATGSLATARGEGHTATLLPSGKVLVAGGVNFVSAFLSSAELYDPGAGTWTATGALATKRTNHTATLLPSGKVLVSGGRSATATQVSSAELYDPGVGTWTATGALATARESHTATLLPSGKVLVAGGYNASDLASAELYDPGVGTWSATGALATARYAHTATLLPSGKVLVAAGAGATAELDSAELYDPGPGTWAAAGVLASARGWHSATMLPTGKMLIAGGYFAAECLASAELYEDTGASESWRPTISSPGPFPLGASAVVTGTLFRGVSGASGGGTNDSPTDFPRVSLQSIDSGRIVTLDVTNFSSTSATVSVPASVPPGRYVLWVAANAIYGGRVVRVGSNVAPVAAAQSPTTNEDTATAITLTGSDVDGDSLTFVVLTQPTGGALTGTGASLTYTPAPNFSGADTFTFRTNDGALDSAPATISVTVAAVNDAPGFNALSNVIALEGSAPPLVSISGVSPGGGADEAVQTVTLTATSSNPALVPNPVVTGTGATRTLSFAPVVNVFGTVTITVTAQDSGGTAGGGVDTFSRTFTITVTAVNQAPTFDALGNVTVLEDAATQMLTINGVGPGGGPDEAAQTVTVTATSSNPAIVPNPTVTGTGATRTLSFTPVANASGAVTVTVTAQDSGGTANGGADTFSRTFTLTVTPVNEPPNLGAISDLTLTEDNSGARTTSVDPGGGGDEAGQSVNVTATSSNPALVPNPVVTGSGGSRDLLISPAPNATGTVTITVTAQDNGGTANGGVDTSSRTFNVTITPVNDAPVFAPIAAQTALEGTPTEVVVTAVGPGGGADEASQSVLFTATSSNPALVPNPTVAGSGPTRTLSMAPVADKFGIVTITVTAQDSGGTAGGGVDTSSQTFTLTVVAANSPPVFDAVADVTLLEDSPAHTIPLTGIGPGGGPDEAGQTVTVVATSPDVLGSSLVVSGTGASRILSVTLPPNAFGTTTVTVKATDDGGGATDSFSRTFKLTATPVNDAPFFAVIDDQHVVGTVGTRAITVTDVGPGGGLSPDEGQVVTVTATSSDTTVVPNPSLTGSGSTRTLTFEAKARGTVTITVTAQDDGGTANGGADTFTRTFQIVVASAVNSPPIAQAGSATSDGEPVALTLKGDDVDGDALSFTVLTQPSQGTLSGDAPNLTYTPAEGYSGVDSFTFKANDGQADSEPATFSITVNGAVARTKSQYGGWGCGCSETSSGPFGLLFLAGLMLKARRRLAGNA